MVRAEQEMWASDDEQRHRVMASSGLGTHLCVVVSSQWLLCTQSVHVDMLLPCTYVTTSAK